MGNAYIVVCLIYYSCFLIYSLEIVEKDHFINVLEKLEEIANSGLRKNKSFISTILFFSQNVKILSDGIIYY